MELSQVLRGNSNRLLEVYPPEGSVFCLDYYPEDESFLGVKNFSSPGLPEEIRKYFGSCIPEGRRDSFQLVSATGCNNLGEVVRRLRPYGRQTEIYWINSFNSTYINSDSKYTVAIANDALIIGDVEHFLCIERGVVGFCRGDLPLKNNILWLVRAPKTRAVSKVRRG